MDFFARDLGDSRVAYISFPPFQIPLRMMGYSSPSLLALGGAKSSPARIYRRSLRIFC